MKSTDPTIQALRKALAQPTDLLQRPVHASDAESALPRLRARIEEVDEAAALITFAIGRTGSVNLPASSAAFRSYPLLAPGGARIGTITSAAMEDGELVCTADIDNSGFLASLVAGEYVGIEAICQTASRRSMDGAPINAVRPLSVRLVSGQSGLNPVFELGKGFYVRRADGRMVKCRFATGAHMGTGVGSGLNAQLSAFKKIHGRGGTPLTEDALVKLSAPRPNARKDVVRRDAPTLALKKALKSGRRFQP